MSRFMERHFSRLSDGICPGPFHLRREWQHGAQYLADGSEIVVRDPFAQLEQVLIEHRRGIKYRMDTLGFDRRRGIVQRRNNPGQALSTEGYQDASANNRSHTVNTVGEYHVQGHRQCYITEFRHDPVRTRLSPAKIRLRRYIVLRLVQCTSGHILSYATSVTLVVT